jgi:hypothetical protein
LARTEAAYGENSGSYCCRILSGIRAWLKHPEKILLERFPITWNHVIEKKSLKFKELEHVLIGKVEQLFRDML